MELRIDEQVVQEQMNKVVTACVEAAFHTHEVQRQIQAHVADEVIGRALSQAISDAVNRLDIEALVTMLAQELQRALVATTVTMLREQTIELLFRMQGGHENHPDKARLKEELRQRLFAAAGSSGQDPA